MRNHNLCGSDEVSRFSVVHWARFLLVKSEATRPNNLVDAVYMLDRVACHGSRQSSINAPNLQLSIENCTENFTPGLGGPGTPIRFTAFVILTRVSGGFSGLAAASIEAIKASILFLS